jgi:hypothetical protein
MGEYEEESVPVLNSGDEAGEVTGESLASSKSSEYEKESLASFESLEYESTNKISTKSNFNNVIRIYVLWCKEIPEPIIGFNHWLSPRNVRECIYKVQAVKWVSMKRRVCVPVLNQYSLEMRLAR